MYFTFLIMKYILIFLSILLFLSPFTFSSSVFAEPNVIVSPTCGNVIGEDFEIFINTNGFFPESFVQWDFIDPNGVRQWHGYFGTNTTGGFAEDTEIEAMEPGEYKLVLYDDAEHDSIVDKNGNVVETTISFPCN